MSSSGASVSREVTAVVLVPVRPGVVDHHGNEKKRRSWHYVAKVKDFGNGQCSVRYSVRSELGQVHDMGLSAADSLRRLADQEARTLRRAKRVCADRCVALGADMLLTLTYKRNEESLTASCDHVAKFVAAIRARVPEWKMVGAAERQKRGAVHWHLAVKGWQKLDLLWDTWLRIIGEPVREQQVNLKEFKGRSAGAIGRYIAKYIGKGFEDERPRYGHHYKTSRGLEVAERVYHLDGGTTVEVLAWCRGAVIAAGAADAFTWTAGKYAMTGGARSW